MITCPICRSRIHTGDEQRMTGDCQCSRETMARMIIELRAEVEKAKEERNRVGAEIRREWMAKAQHLDHTATLAKERADRAEQERDDLRMQLADRDGR